MPLIPLPYDCIECIPNISEGQNIDLINRIKHAIESKSDTRCIHTDIGYSVNRTVLTLIGTQQSVIEGVYEMYREVSELLDMRQHRGTHPRMGAVDVCPFVILGHNDPRLLNNQIHQLANRIGNDFGIPIFLYEQSATHEDRKLLANIRKGEFEGWHEKIKNPKWKPDYGPNEWHTKLGGSVMGMRAPLVAFNLNIKGGDLKSAKKLASQIREHRHRNDVDTGPHLKGVRAIGWYIPEFDSIQLSMNITDLDSSPVHIVYETAKKLADDIGCEVTGSELIGMIPESTMISAAEFYNAPSYDIESMVNHVAEAMKMNQVKTFDYHSNVLKGV